MVIFFLIFFSLPKSVPHSKSVALLLIKFRSFLFFPCSFSIVFSYDARGRVEAMLRYTETIGFDAIYYKYNSMDAPTKITVCDGLRSMNIWYGYDEFGRVDTVWSKLNQSGLYGTFYGTNWNINDLSFSNIDDDILPDSADVVLSHNSLGQLDSIYYVLPKIVTNFTYDNMSWLTSIHSKLNSNQNIFTQLLQRDHRGNIVGETNLLGHLLTELTNSIYSYDSYNQLTNSNIISKGFSYNNNYIYDCNSPVGNGFTFGNRFYSFENVKSALNDSPIMGSLKVYYYNLIKKNQLTRYEELHNTYGQSPLNIRKYSYYGDGALSARSLFSNNNLAIFANVKQSVEQFDYDYRGLMNKYRKGEVFASDTCNISQMLLTDVEWQYRYNPFGERESKYMTVNSLDERKLRPMEYYLLGTGNEQFAVYNGFSIADTMTIFLKYQNSWYPIYFPADSNKKYIYPTEYNVYSAEGVFSSYRMAYGVVQKNYFIYNHLGSKAVEVDSAGNIIDYVQYSPFGEPLKKNNYQPQWNERLGYIDKEKDRESKLGDHGVRKYDYEIGRFTSVDPLFEKFHGWSPYNYSFNNPINLVDRSGEAAYLIIWSPFRDNTGRDNAGHAGIAVDLYDDNGKTTGKMLYYDLAPDPSINFNQDNFDKNVKPSYTLNELSESDFDTDLSGLYSGRLPNGILKINTAGMNTDNLIHKKLQDEKNAKIPYNAQSNNCSHYAQEALRIAFRDNSFGAFEYFNMGFWFWHFKFASPTPNALFKKASHNTNTEIIRNPGDEVNKKLSD